MIRLFVLQLCLPAVFFVGALAVLGVGIDVQAQPHPNWRIEKTWKCRTCGGFLGNGVAPPPYCHHCAAKRAAATERASSSKDGPALGTIAIVGVGVFTVAALSLLFMSNRFRTGGNS